MTEAAAKILKEALQLPAEARAAIAGTLLESLDDRLDPDAESKWEAEIARRARELDSGRIRPVPWSVARRAIAGE